MQQLISKLTKRTLILFSLVIFSSFTFVRYVFDKNDVIFGLLFDSLKQLHYSPNNLDDAFSEKVFDLYVNTNFNKQFLLQSDIDALKKYRTDIDDQIAGQRHEFYNETQEILSKRIKEKENWSKEFLSKPIDFSVEEEFEVDYKKATYAKDEASLKNEWRKWLKYQVLFRLDDLLTKQEKSDTAKAGSAEKIAAEKTPKKSFDSLEIEARRATVKAQELMFKRLNKISPRDRFAEFANAVTGVYDPHTQYFAPKEKKAFYQGLSGQFEGIGARLQQKPDGALEVSEVILGSPSHKQGELKKGDEILKVAQGVEKPVDITAMEMEDAIELIKGKKGTEVRLTVRKVDKTTVVIPIIRDVIEIEGTFARSAILDNKNKIGYIYLPVFYTPFDREATRKSSTDVKKEIEKLKKLGVKGIVLDLRDNGGGSLQEVIDLAGLFFPTGPVVQVKGKTKTVNVIEDRNPEVSWDGPLTVLINHHSASASEILAAALQDYKRGVVLGTTSFGKGTVQSFVDLDNYLLPQFDTIKPIGSVKITQQKYYRISGGATQLKGVTPDIILPDPYALIESGEKEYEYPMPWDEITKATYNEFKNINYMTVVKNSYKRVKANPQFTLIEQQAQEVKLKSEDTKYSLKLETFRNEQKQMRAQNKKYDDLRKEIKGFSASLLEEDKQRVASDTARLNREIKWAKNISKDVYVHEATNVINDMR